MAIDDELDAIKNQYPAHTDNVVLELAIKSLSLIPTLALAGTLAEVLRSHFSTRAMTDRLSHLVDGLEKMVRSQGKDLSDIRRLLDDPGFANAYAEAANVAVFTTELKKIEQFGGILGNELAGDAKLGWDEAAAMIADLSRLTDKDLDALRLLVKHQGKFVRDKFYDSEFTDLSNKMRAVLGEIDDLKIPRYDFYARALRLSGFGFAMPINFNPSLSSPEDLGFAPTPRGKRLVELLGDAKTL